MIGNPSLDTVSFGWRVGVSVKKLEISCRILCIV